MTDCFQVREADNVATMLGDAEGEVRVLGAGGGPVALPGPVAAGHKIALRDIGEGEAVVKYGARIGRATRRIRRGEWVHLHNMASDMDERSGTLDPRSGAPTDTRYE